MSKVLFTIELPKPKVRKPTAPSSKAFKSKVAYVRKQKHKKEICHD